MVRLVKKQPRIKGYESCRCNQDHLHDSRGEARYCNQLELERRAGEIKSYISQKTFRLMVKGKEVCQHRVDFLVTNNDGTKEVREYKGVATGVWRIKHKLFTILYPKIPYKVKGFRDLWR